MKHKDWQDLLPFYIANTLDLMQREAVEEHLLHCSDCSQEVDAWRMIASAVWEEADQGARRHREIAPSILQVVPQLSQRTLVRQQIFAPNNRRLVGQTKSWMPLTMVAGMILTIMLGGLLVLMSIQDGDAAANQAIALNPTSEGDSAAELGYSAITRLEISPTVAGDDELGILPTPLALEAVVFATPTSTPLRPPNSGGGIAVLPTSLPTSLPPPTAEVGHMELAGGPYITMTPGLVESGYQLCKVFNPTGIPLAVYANASFEAVIIGGVDPGLEFRTLVRSDSGWFQVFLGVGRIGWIPPASTYLRGSCDLNQFWIPTATAISLSTPLPPEEVIVASSKETIVITVDVANLHEAPDNGSAVLAYGLRNQQLPLLAYYSASDERWFEVLLPDGRAAYMTYLGGAVYNNDELPASPTPEQ